MTTFDAEAYEHEVVKPLRGRGGRLPEDLASRYAVDLGMPDADLNRRLADVRALWHKSAQSPAKPASLRNVYKAFLRADEELRRSHGAAMSRVSWWRQQKEERAEAHHDQIGELVRMLRANFGELGLITPGQMEVMRATFPALAPSEVDKALTEAGLRMAKPVELPTTSGLQDTLYRRLKSLLADAEASSIVELLAGELESFRILGSFAGEPPHPTGLGAAAVRQAIEREDRRSGNQSAREALNLLNTAVRGGTDLHQLTLFHMLDDVRRHRDRGAPAAALLKQLHETKLEAGEGRQIVVSVLSETTTLPTTPVTGLPKVREQLEDGNLIAAQQALATITDPDEATTARLQVDRQVEQVHNLREAAHRALRRGEEDDARLKLRMAVSLSRDDPQLVAELNRIPLPPVLEVSAHPEGTSVRVAWRAATSHDPDTLYRVVRRDGRVPTDVADGETIAEVSAVVHLDPAPPAGKVAGYAVFATADGQTWSRPGGVTLEFFPPVHDVRIASESGTVQAQWKVHPDVLAVNVRRQQAGVPGSAEVRTSSTTSFHETVQATGDYIYTFTAAYRKPDGTEGLSTPVIVTTAGSSGMRPISALRLAAVPGRPCVAVSWRQRSGDRVTIRRAEEPPEWDFGETVPLDLLSRYGRELTGSREIRAGTQTLTAEVPIGRYWYVPFTLGTGEAVCGQDAVFGIVPSVSGLGYQRFGPELVLSWIWPDSAGLAEVTWSGTESGKRRITRQEYQAAGGVRVRVGAGPATVQVTTLARSHGDDSRSAPLEIDVPATASRLAYTVERKLRAFGGGGTARIRLRCEQDIPECILLVVVAPGSIMPRHPQDGLVVHRDVVRLNAQGEAELKVEIPRMRKPYWVRCFVAGAETVRLTDPPTQQMKVS